MSSSLNPSADSPPHIDCESSPPHSATVGRSLELELLPRLLAHAMDRVGQSDWPVKANMSVAPSDLDGFVRACLSHDEERCPSLITNLIEAGMPLERICLDLLAPAARALGRLWEDDDIDFLDVTLGLGRMQRVVRDLGRRVAAETPMSEDAGQAFLCAMPNEQHSLGLAMVAELFVADGWGVTVGHPIGNSDVVHEIAAHWYDVVGLSAGIVEQIPKITELVRSIRDASLNAHLAIMVGGRAFLDNPALVDVVGADASAPDAAQGPMVARTLLHARRVFLEESSPPSDSPSP